MQLESDLLKVFTTNTIKVFSMLLATFFIPAALSVGEYSTYKLYALIASYIGLLHFGFNDGVFVEYGGRNLLSLNKNNLANEQTTIICLELVLSGIMITVSLITGNIILLIVSANVIPTILISYYALLYQSTGEFRRYANVYNLLSVLSITTNATLVFIIKYDNGLLYACTEVLVNYIVALFAAFSYNRKLQLGRGHFSLQILKKYIFIGFLLTIGNVAFVLFGSIDKWFVKILLGSEEFAYYAFAVQLLSILNFFVGPIGFTLYNYMCRRKEKEYEYKLKSVIAILLFLLLSVEFLAKFFVDRFFTKYSASISIISILFLAQVFLLLNTVLYVNLYKSYKMQRQYFRNLVLAILLSTFLNIIICALGYPSSQAFACSTLISTIFWAILNLRDFKYLRFKYSHLTFVVILSITYIFLNIKCGDVISFIIYTAVWAFLFYYLAHDVLAELTIHFKMLIANYKKRE